jgi:regulator of sigma E protease
MGVTGTVLAFVLVLVVLVLVHELGHFVVAKMAGITVQEFGIGFPPRIGSVVWRGTRYSVNWIPLGGFVKMLGEDGEIEADKMRQRGLSETAVERAMEGAFNRKPIWIRIIVLVAGVAMNFLLAVVLFGAASSLPTPNRLGPLTVTAVQPGSPAATTLKVGDQITAADGSSYPLARDLTAYVTSRAGHDVRLTIKRGGHIVTVTVVPRVLSEADRQRGLGPVGFSWSAQPEPPIATGPIDALAHGATISTQIAVQIPAALGQTVMGLIGLAPNTGDARGPIGIAQATGEVLQEPLVFQLAFVGLLSVNLAVLNVLPFPPLDGGRVAVVIIEAVRRRRLPAEREALIYITGFLVLMALVILISIQDIARLPGS